MGFLSERLSNVNFLEAAPTFVPEPLSAAGITSVLPVKDSVWGRTWQRCSPTRLENDVSLDAVNRRVPGIISLEASSF